MRDFEAWAEFGDALRRPAEVHGEALPGIPWQAARFETALPLIDVGPGSGATTVALAEQFPQAEVVAVEPDWLMRSLLMTRLSERSEVQARTTVLPGAIQDTWLPDRCGGALLFNVIYFLGERERERFWERMADVLVPGAPVLMSRSYGGAADTDVERKLVSSGAVGRQEYQRWYSSRSLGDGRVEIVNHYLVLRDGEVVRDEETRITPYGIGEDLIVDEVPVGAFGIEEIDERYLAIRRHPDLKRRKRR